MQPQEQVELGVWVGAGGGSEGREPSGVGAAGDDGHAVVRTNGAVGSL